MAQPSERKFSLREYKSISHAISTYEDMQLLLQHFVEGICRTFKIRGCSILFYDEREKQLFRVSSHGLSEEYINKGSIYMEDVCNEFLQGKLLVFDDLKNDARVEYADSAIKEGIVFMMSIPIKFRDSLIGLMKVYHSESIDMHEEDKDSLLVLLEQLGLVIEINGLKNFVDNVKAAMENLPLHVSEEL